MAYDPKEAESIFANAHLQLDPTAHYDGRMRAAHALLDAVAQAAENAGYTQRTPRYGVRVIGQQNHGLVAVVVADDQFSLQVEGPPPRSITDLAIEYDPVTKTFVGKAEDKFSLPVPGAPPKKRSAVAVVAERIVALVREQSEARKQVR